jgi:integrase
VDPSSYLRPKAPRRDYYSQERASTGPPSAVPPRPGAVPTVEEAIHGLLQAHATDCSSTTLRNARHYLLLNRFPAYCAEKRIVTIDQLTTGHIEEFLAGLSRILKAETLVKYRTYLRALARFCAETPGYPSPGLADVERLPVPRIARRKLPIALTKEQEATVLEAAAPGRDQLIVETLLACGVRVSELCALLVSDLVLDHRPPYIHVRGTVSDRDLTKSGALSPEVVR